MEGELRMKSSGTRISKENVRAPFWRKEIDFAFKSARSRRASAVCCGEGGGVGEGKWRTHLLVDLLRARLRVLVGAVDAAHVGLSSGKITEKKRERMAST